MNRSSKTRATLGQKWIALSGASLVTFVFLYLSQLVTLADEIPVSEQASSKTPIVVIDAGHGGHDPGGDANGVIEKNLTLVFAKKLELALQAKGIQSLMTRDADHYLTLSKRSAMGDRDKALFISLHINSSPKGDRDGIEVFDLKHGKNGRPASKILVSHLAKNLEQVEAQPKVVTRNAHFSVLSGAQCPAVLVELGFITNPQEREKLVTEEYQNELVAKLRDGIAAFIESRD